MKALKRFWDALDDPRIALILAGSFIDGLMRDIIAERWIWAVFCVVWLFLFLPASWKQLEPVPAESEGGDHD